MAGALACPSPGRVRDDCLSWVLLRGTRPQNCSPISGLAPRPRWRPILARSGGSISPPSNRAGLESARCAPRVLRRPGPVGGQTQIRNVATLRWLDPPANRRSPSSTRPAAGRGEVLTCETVPEVCGCIRLPGGPRAPCSRGGRRSEVRAGRLPGRPTWPPAAGGSAVCPATAVNLACSPPRAGRVPVHARLPPPIRTDPQARPAIPKRPPLNRPGRGGAIAADDAGAKRGDGLGMASA